MTLSTHVLDAARGRPAVGVPVHWETLEPNGRWAFVAAAVTDADGRIVAGAWLATGQAGAASGPTALSAGGHRLVFDTGAWFLIEGLEGFYPEVVVTFTVTDPADHHHVPLLLSPFAYSTYRGS
ncbi:MAG TPA: hydroxyisourate hydrolase [Kineosporiaceae bacterium]|nr:hydroxyisourate hydrolase [Kineosporiaceae bacterium]